MICNISVDVIKSKLHHVNKQPQKYQLNGVDVENFLAFIY